MFFFLPDAITSGIPAVGAAGELFNRLVNVFDHRDRFRIGLAEILNHAVHRRQNQEQIGRQQRGDERGKLVVVAEFKFGERNRVVLVDDRHDAPAEQRHQRVARVEMAFVMFQVVVRQQHLRDVKVELRKKFFVNRHQSRLADGGARLQFGEIIGPSLVAERAHARAHGAGRDEHDLLPGFALRGDLRDQLLQLRQIRLLPAVREDTGAEFHHHAGNIFKQFATHARVVSKWPASVENSRE
jgi:hypothetical protein